MSLELIPQPARHDVSGYAVFSQGDEGDAHVMAHRMLDEGRYELGRRLLGDWLATNEGQGSCWTHLQWHMAVFEIAAGQWEVALARFETEILPVAARSFDAVTDAPAMLWRLKLAAPARLPLNWEPVRKTAARQLARRTNAYVELHCLLALAGAGDVGALDRWLERDCPRAPLLTQLGSGLRALAAGEHEVAAALLAQAAPNVSHLGGSHAQNQLFIEIAEHVQTQAHPLTQAA